MEFRDLKSQYRHLKLYIDSAIESVLLESNYISGRQVRELEDRLAEYVGVKHCISCANGTDALQLALAAWGIGAGDAVFVPDFTFFSTGEVVAASGAVPVFVDVSEDTFNMNPDSLEDAISAVIGDGDLVPRAVIPVDLFGQPADYDRIIPIAEKYGLSILEDGAQGFGGQIGNKRACSFGNISTTSFFPAKPLGCYGDGGAIFTDDDDTAKLMRSLAVHGKGEDKYDNVRIGMNSRLDTIQAAVLGVKLKAFSEYELDDVNKKAAYYTEILGDVEKSGKIKTPKVIPGMTSSWAQYSILLEDGVVRDDVIAALKAQGIPSMIYYKKPMHLQRAFEGAPCVRTNLYVTEDICGRVLSLPVSPYITEGDINTVASVIREFYE